MKASHRKREAVESAEPPFSYQNKQYVSAARILRVARSRYFEVVRAANRYEDPDLTRAREEYAAALAEVRAVEDRLTGRRPGKGDQGAVP